MAGLINIGNGLSQMGTAVSDFAGNAGLAAQRADLERQRDILADQLATTRETTLETQRQAGASSLETQRQAGQQQIAEGEHTFQSGQQSERLTTEESIEASRRASAEKIAGGQQAIGRAALTPDEVRTADWLSKASPVQREAYQMAQGAKAGVPLWMSGAVSSGAPSTSTAPGKVANAVTGAVANSTDAAFSNVPDQAKPTIKAMLDGRQPPPTAMAMTKPYWQTMMALANRVDPNFDQTTWQSRNSTRKDFTAGQSSKGVTALNTALGHAGVVLGDLDKLDNFGGVFTPLNSAKNFVEKTIGDTRQTNAQTSVSALASEARKVFAASGGGNLTELENWETNFPVNGSPTQQRGAVKEFVNLLDSRLSSLADTYNRGMGKTEEPLSLLAPHAREIYQQVMGNAPANSTGYADGKSPGGIAALPSIDTRVVGKTYQTPTGPHKWMGDGWAPDAPAGR